jgi:ferrochelatase
LTSKRIAIVLFNLGGPDHPEAVQPFLFNLFNDPAIIGAPGFIRWALAHFISRRRAPIAQEIYARIGGRSPIMPETELQADGLSARLSELGEVKTFIAMRYWHPRARETAKAVLDFKPDEIVLLPLYPQFSTTTSESSLKEWSIEATRIGLKAPSHALCCYPTQSGFVEAMADLVQSALGKAEARGAPRILFSAHGLPERVIAGGDPYQAQVEMTADAVMAKLARPDVDWLVCYQSRVGPLKWIGPSTDKEIERAGADGVPLIIVPIAFVSEHSETLVELDIEYKHLADESGVPFYVRVPAVRNHSAFLDGLADMVRTSLTQNKVHCGQGDGGRICPVRFMRCPLAA